MEREKDVISVLLTLDEPTNAMRTEAASAGFYKSPWGEHPCLQIVTVGELLAGHHLDIPAIRQTGVTFKRPSSVRRMTSAEAPMRFGAARIAAASSRFTGFSAKAAA